MSTKISGLSSDPAPIGAGRPADRVRDSVTGSSAPPAENPSSAPGDLHITGPASQLANLEQALRSLPAVDQTRVTQFRTAIEQGTYTVQPQQVADQLMRLERSLSQLPEG